MGLFRKIISLLLCAALLVSSADRGWAFLADGPSFSSRILAPRVVRLPTDPAYFTERALVQRLTDFHNSAPRISTAFQAIHNGLFKPVHPKVSWFKRADVVMIGYVGFIAALHLMGLSTSHSNIKEACGLVGAILLRHPSWKGVLPAPVRRRFYLMMQVTKTRGEQAGGIAVFTQWFRGFVSVIRMRIVNFKRANLPKILDRLIRIAVWISEHLGARPLANGMVLVIGHFRFGTSSPPSRSETHPHRFLPPRVVKYWQVIQGKFAVASACLAILITHNGDFDWFHWFGKFRSNEEMGWYMERVLDRPANRAYWAWTGGWKGLSNPLNWLRWFRQLTIAFFSGAGRGGDSPKLAAVLDFVATQGMWDASARFAYQWSLASGFEEAFGGQDPNQEKFAQDKPRISTAPNGAPSVSRIDNWAETFESVFQQYQGRLLIDGAKHPSEVKPEVLAAMKADMVRQIQMVMSRQGYNFDNAKIAAFVDTTVNAFLHHDLTTSVRWILMRSRGSFGFGVASTLEPGKVVNASMGQPLTHGFILAEGGSEEEGVYWVSEPGAVKVKISPEDPGILYRLDLKQGAGEMSEITPQAVKYIRIADGKEQTAQEIVGEGRIVDMVDNKYITPLPELSEKDMVGSDISQIAQVLAAIREDWKNPKSFNRETAQEFFRQMLEIYLYKNLKIRISSNQLDKSPYYEEVVWQKAQEYASALLDGSLTPAQWFENAAAFATRIRNQLPPSSYTTEDIHKNDVDILLSGIETSQWVSEQFAGRLKRIFPTLNIISESSNKVLAGLHDFNLEDNILRSKEGKPYDYRMRISTDKGSVKVGKRTVKLFVSQHGQTYASLNGAEQMYKLDHEVGEDRVFVLTGEIDGAMGTAVGQAFARNAIFRRRIFVNGSGRRPSEASTVATLAADMTAAELLIDLSQNYLNLFTDAAMGEMRQTITAMEPQLAKRDLQNGATSHLDDARNPFRHKLTQKDLDHLKRARDRFVDERAPSITRRGQAVYETLVRQGRKWADHILEGPLSVWISWALIGLFVSIFKDLPAHKFHITVGADLFNFLFYTVILRFGIPFFLRLIAALWTGQTRQWYARLGKRTVAIADRPHVHEMLNQYVSKLFSMSYKDQSIDVQSANSNDHFIHRMAHRVVRGTLIYIGFPDWDKASQQLGVEASRMTGSQSKGIENGLGPISAGPEVVAVGANIQYRGNAMDVAINLTPAGDETLTAPSRIAEELEEDIFGTMERLMAGYVFFWAMAKKVSSLWPFRWSTSQSQSGTRSGTTRSPVPSPDSNGAGPYHESGLIESSISEPIQIRDLIAQHEQSQGLTPPWLKPYEKASKPEPARAPGSQRWSFLDGIIAVIVLEAVGWIAYQYIPAFQVVVDHVWMVIQHYLLLSRSQAGFILPVSVGSWKALQARRFARVENRAG